MHRYLSATLLGGTLFVWCVADAQSPPPAPIVYPAKGQSADQTKKDESECHQWAAQTTGFDPSKPQPAPAQSAQTQHAAPSGHRGRSMVGGAALGAAIGEIAEDDAGKGAAWGAVAGTLAGGRRARMQAAEQQQAAAQKQQQTAAAEQAKVEDFNRAAAACLEGRGYVVK